MDQYGFYSKYLAGQLSEQNDCSDTSRYDVYLCRDVKKEQSYIIVNINPIFVRGKQTIDCYYSFDGIKPWYKRLWLFLTKR